MTEERVTPLHQRMIEDINIRGLTEKTQTAHIRNVKHFAAFLGRSPDTATPEELRPRQLVPKLHGHDHIRPSTCDTSARNSNQKWH